MKRSIYLEARDSGEYKTNWVKKKEKYLNQDVIGRGRGGGGPGAGF